MVNINKLILSNKKLTMTKYDYKTFNYKKYKITDWQPQTSYYSYGDNLNHISPQQIVSIYVVFLKQHWFYKDDGFVDNFLKCYGSSNLKLKIYCGWARVLHGEQNGF